MAYGKNQADLARQGSFRQKTGNYSQKKNESRGSGKSPYFVGQYKPSTTDVDTVRLVEGQYQVPQIVGSGDKATTELIELPFFPFTEHFDGRNMRSCICSAGPFSNIKNKAEPCHGCAIYWATREQQADGKKKSDRMSRSEKFVFTVIDYGKYHKVPQVDRDTKQVRTADDGTPYTNWEKCTGLGCKGCPSAIETVQGKTRHWPLGYAHYKTVLETDKEIGKSCRSCGSVNSVTGLAWLCPVDAGGCGEAIIDFRSTSLTQKQVDEIVDRSYHCRCGYEGFLQELIQCAQCTPVGGTARRATIFDVDMNVKRIETSTGEGKQTALQISQWSPPRPVDVNFKELAKPMDLAKIYAPTDLKTQAEQFGVPVSDLPGPQRQPVTGASRPYGGMQQPQQPQQPAMPGPPSMSGPAMPPPGMIQQPQPQPPAPNPFYPQQPNPYAPAPQQNPYAPQQPVPAPAVPPAQAVPQPGYVYTGFAPEQRVAPPAAAPWAPPANPLGLPPPNFPRQ